MIYNILIAYCILSWLILGIVFISIRNKINNSSISEEEKKSTINYTAFWIIISPITLILIIIDSILTKLRNK